MARESCDTVLEMPANSTKQSIHTFSPDRIALVEVGGGGFILRRADVDDGTPEKQAQTDEPPQILAAG